MGLSTDVRLPKSQAPRFPDRCVVCGQEHPDGKVRVSTNAIGWWTWLHWLPGRTFAVEVPACSWCGARLRRQRLFRLLTTIAFIAAAILLIMPLLDGFQRAIRRWVGLGAVLAALSPWFLWETLFPPPIDLTAYSDSVDYEFRDGTYAEEFAALNDCRPDASPEEENEREE